MSEEFDGTSKIIKSNQEQAVAAWVNYLNQLRIDQLLNTLRAQDVHLRDALVSVDDAISEIKKLITANIGGQKGMHGFIAEIAETGVGNARSLVLGGDKLYEWVNDNGPIDLMYDGIGIQQKFYASGGSFGLGAISKHLKKYPDYLASGHRYQIPKDHFEVVAKLYKMSPEDAGKFFANTGEGPTYKNWLRVQKFFDEGSVPFDSLEPSHLEYHEVQRGAYGSTMEAEKASLHETDKSQRDKAYMTSKPSLKEGSQATLVAAIVEGGTTFVMAVVQKRREGKKLKNFTSDDWNGIAGDTGFSFAKGGVRGCSIYTLTNVTATSAAAASAIVTAAFGIAEQANKLRRGEISEQEFIENAELVSLEASVSALSSFLGQALIPVPVLGAVLGNTVGMVMYKAVATTLSEHEAQLIKRYLEEQRVLDERLAAEYQDLINQLDKSLAGYFEVLERSFSPDLSVALSGSIELALELGVVEDEVLDSDEKTRNYFLN